LSAVYLDHNATTPVHPKVAEAIAAYLSAEPGNPSSIHRPGRAAARFRDEARERLAVAAGCRPEEVVFTSGGTEADNLALRGSQPPGGGHLVTATTEHEAVLQTAESLEHSGTRVTLLTVDRDGRVDPAHVAEAIRPDTTLVSIMSANNETGVLQPIAAIGAICRARGVLFHTDAVQFFGKLPFCFAELPVDLASVSAHKIGGPKGIGALLVRRGIEIAPVLTGGSQERRVRPGTENLPGIVGFGTAAEIALRDLTGEIARLAGLRDRLERGILGIVPEARVNGGGAARLTNTANVSFQEL
jgi:cysteine desulfurase